VASINRLIKKIDNCGSAGSQAVAVRGL